MNFVFFYVSCFQKKKDYSKWEQAYAESRPFQYLMKTTGKSSSLEISIIYSYPVHFLAQPQNYKKNPPRKNSYILGNGTL